MVRRLNEDSRRCPVGALIAFGGLTDSAALITREDQSLGSVPNQGIVLRAPRRLKTIAGFHSRGYDGGANSDGGQEVKMENE